MKNSQLSMRKEVWLVAAALLGSCGLAQAASTDVANSPLFTSATTSVKPNVMFLLDDSGSMAWDFLPDNAGNGTSNMCRGSGCNTGSDVNTGTRTSGAPFLAQQFNNVYYDPTVTYSPPLDFDGTNTTFKSYNNSVGFLWSAVKVNPFPGGSATTKNLTTSFPEEIWCDGSQSGPPATFDAVHCRRNLQPNATFSVSVSNSRSSTTNTVTVTLANHNCSLGDKVTIVGTTGSPNLNGTFTVATVPTTSTFTYTFTSASSPSTSGTPAASACNIPITKLSSVGTTATAVFPITHGCLVGDTVNISGASTAGYNVSATVTGVSSANILTYTTALSNLANVEGSGATSGQFIARSSLCPGTPSNYSTSTTVPPLMQGFPQGIFSRQVTLNGTPYYYTILPNEYCTDSNLNTCQATVSETIGSPATAYTFPAKVRYCVSSAAANASPAAPGATGNGSTTGCTRPYAGSFTFARYGYFTRVNIVSGTATYPKASSRTDCVTNATTCTYNEEMSNFANWYAYYRARIMMTKSAAGIAFNRLNTSYRVGFNTINAAGSGQWLANAPFDNAVGGQKSQWYSKMYNISPNSSTPLRTAISRIGRYYAGMKSSAAGYISDDPIQYSCQQNLAFLITDGYWNGTGGIKLDGSAMGDQDGKPGVVRPFLDAFASSGGDGGGTLADVAYYYYVTDLRTPSFNPIGALGLDVTQNNVPPTTKDPNTAQHMVTFTMGLGLDSTLIYKPGYDTSGTSPDYNAVVNGSKNWPAPVHDDITAVDDLWHAAVNGRGTYFSAKSPSIVTSGLVQAFASLSQRTSDESAAATSTPNIVPGDNFVFSSNYTSVDWFGETTEQEINASTGALIPTIQWSAQTQLDAMVSATSDTRTINTFDSTNGATHLKSFLWANLTAAEQAFFNGTSGGRDQLSQWSVLTSAQQNQCDNPGGADCGQKLVNYLRGQRAYETPVNSLITPDSANTSLFRHRTHILGDIVSAEAVYVRLPIFNYGDQGYSTFKSNNASRQAALYVAANDGMLHALNATTGVEMWAYIPSVVMPNMWQLARFDYSTNHLFFVDGTPTAGDICTSNCGTSSATWATIIVGGFNAGGRGYYALDITNPASPKALWELKSSATCIPSVNNVPQNPVPANTFSDCDIGLSFGNPIITKRVDGKWVVLVTSGYNNISPGTGGGFLYVIDAVTGAILSKVATLILNPPGFAPGFINAGNTTTPSGFAKINAFAASTDTDNTTLRVYGGDLNGNLWRIDGAGAPNTLSAGVNQATLLAMLSPANGLGTQGNGTNSITTKPELGELVVMGVGTIEMVYVGSGRYLGVTDLTTTTQESFYGIVDPLGSFSGYGAVHGNANFVKQTLTEVVNPSTLAVERFTTSNTVDYTSKKGWFIDFNPGNVSPGERSNTDPVLTLGILSFTTNAPDSNACNIGGKSYRYFLNYTSGGPLSTSVGGVSGALIGFALSTRPVVVEVNGKLEQIINTQGVPQIFSLPPLVPPAGGKRIFWREINP